MFTLFNIEIFNDKNIHNKLKLCKNKYSTYIVSADLTQWPAVGGPSVHRHRQGSAVKQAVSSNITLYSSGSQAVVYELLQAALSLFFC